MVHHTTDSKTHPSGVWKVPSRCLSTLPTGRDHSAKEQTTVTEMNICLQQPLK